MQYVIRRERRRPVFLLVLIPITVRSHPPGQPISILAGRSKELFSRIGIDQLKTQPRVRPGNRIPDLALVAVRALVPRKKRSDPLQRSDLLRHVAQLI